MSEDTYLDRYMDAINRLAQVDMRTMSAKELWELFEETSSAKRMYDDVCVRRMVLQYNDSKEADSE